MDGCPRQNPAYRLLKIDPASAGSIHFRWRWCEPTCRAGFAPPGVKATTMSPGTRPWRPRATALAAFAAALAAAALVALLALSLSLRDDAARTSAALAAQADALAVAVDDARPAVARETLAGAGVAARIVGPRGRITTDGALGTLWDRGAAPFPARVATWGGADVGHGFVEQSRPLSAGRTLVVRAPLAMGTAGVLGGGIPLIVAILIVALIAGGVAWWRSARLDARVQRLAGGVDALAAGRAVAFPRGGRGAWGDLEDALGRASRRLIELQGAAEVRMEALGAAVAPLPLPVAARTPSGGLVRNDALERLVAGAATPDADAVEDAVRGALAGSGAVARRLDLSDGRTLEVEAWPVPGGRLVVLAERTEQARLEAVRANVVGAASRNLRRPITEIQARGAELLARASGDAAGPARDILAGADRLERLVSRMLRSAGIDDGSRAVRPRSVSVASVAFGLGQAYDRRLRDRGLRLEHDVPGDLPAVAADPGLLHEVLAELLDNASAFTPRGGVITLRGRAVRRRTVEIAIVDTGAGIAAADRALIAEPFGRGGAASTRPGAGLGLGVARTLVERMGGRLAVESGPGGVARVELPAADAPPSAADSRESSPATPADASRDGAEELSGVGAAAP